MYLYGFQVTAIQSYIFATNKLREIIGASEVIESICSTHLIKKLLPGFDNDKLLFNAAGSIRYLFNTEAAAQAFAKGIADHIETAYPTISYQQALQEVSSPNLSSKEFEALIRKLKAARNLIAPIQNSSLLIEKKAPRTGRVAYKQVYRSDHEKEWVDYSTYEKDKLGQEINQSTITAKIKTGFSLKFPTLMDEIANDAAGNWVAVIHADGNNLGRIVQKLADWENAQLKGNSVEKSKLKIFSEEIERITQAALSEAVRDTFVDEEVSTEQLIPFRPVIVGGDDITVICRADKALLFTKTFLALFHEKSKGVFKEWELPEIRKGLTACAGIAYVKHKFPLHYAVNLAGDLCKKAKEVSKQFKEEEFVPASLYFHKIRDTAYTDFEDVFERELKIEINDTVEEPTTSLGVQLSKVLKEQGIEGQTVSSINYNYGPYFIDLIQENPYCTVVDLLQKLKRLNHPKAPDGPLREWLSTNFYDTERAAYQFSTLLKNHEVFFTNMIPFHRKENEKVYYIFHDLLTLYSLKS